MNSPYDWERDSKLAGWILVISTVEVIIFFVVAITKNNPLILTIAAAWVCLLFPIRYWVINRILGTTIYKGKEHKEKMKKRIENKRKQKETQVKKSHFPDWALKDQEERYVLKLGKSFIKNIEFCGYATIDGIELPLNIGKEHVWNALDRTSRNEIVIYDPELTTVIAKAQFMTRWEATLAQRKFGGEIKRVELCDPMDSYDVPRWRESFD